MQFMAPASAQGQPPPELVEMQAKMKATQTQADARMLEAQGKVKEGAERIKMEKEKTAATLKIDSEKLMNEKASIIQKGKHEEQDTQRQHMNDAFKERIELANVAGDIAEHPESAGLVAPLIRPAIEDIHKQDGGLNPGNGRVQ